MHAIHFGAYLDDPNYAAVPTVYGHSDPEGLHEPITLGYMHRSLTAYVSGSWACWGPADNAWDDDTDSRGDGDESIHIVVYVPDHIRITPEYLLALRLSIYDGDPSNSANYRLLDYAVVSDAEDWSEQTHVVTYRGNPEVVIQSTNRKGFIE